MSALAEPAVKSYFFDKGYRDLWATIRDAWVLNQSSASAFAQKAEKGSNIFEKGMWFAAAASVVVFGTIFFIAVSAVHITILFLVFGFIYCAFSVLYLAERVYLLARSYYTVCPHCHEKAPLPEYFCDRCKAVHARLIPSSYGILRRTCLCGQKLPATFFGDRGRLQARCAHCKMPLRREHTPDDQSNKLFIPVIGGPSVGKSAFLFAAVWKFVDEQLPKMGYTHEFVEARDRHNFEKVRNNFKSGRVPDKTTDTLPTAFNLKITTDHDAKRVLYFYDPAGEAFNQSEGLAMHKFHGYVSGCIFLVDPFAIPQVQRIYASELSRFGSALKPSSLALEDTLARVILNLEENFKLSKTERIKFPIAVVVNKVDAFGIRDQIQKSAEAAKASAVANPKNPPIDPVRAQLLAWGQGGLIQTLETRFSRVAFFPCSALGRLPDGNSNPFGPEGVLDPLMWVLNQADSKFVSRKMIAANI